jgi:hypothetical protein
LRILSRKQIFAVIIRVMPAETMHLIDPSDIIGIEFLCTKCQLRVIHRLDRFEKTPATCPNCLEAFVPARSDEDQAIQAAVDAIGALIKRGFAIRFQVTGWPELPR